MFLYIFTFLEILICLAVIFMIMIQKNSDGVIAKNSFGPIGRTNSVIRITYFLTFLFVLNTFALNVLMQKEYKSSSLQEMSKKTQ